MKAERRHELQHNPTADWLAAVIERIKPYSRAIAGVAVAAAVLLTTYVVLSGRSERRQSQAWTDYYQAIQANSIEDIAAKLETVTHQHSGIAAGLWAEVTLADLSLGEGVDLLFRDKQTAQTKLKSAVGHYETVLEDAEDPLLVSRARFGLGRALESLGQLDLARDAYKEVVDASGTNAYVSLAETRLKDLEDSSTKDFYAWFAKQEPAPLPATDSLPGTPGEKPPFDTSTFGPTDGLNLSDGKILDIPPLDAKTTGPLLSPATKPSETGSKATDTNVTGSDGTGSKVTGSDNPEEGGKAEASNDEKKDGAAEAESKDGKTQDTKDEQPATEEKSQGDANEANDDTKSVKDDEGSQSKSADDAQADESGDAQTPNGGA